MMRASRASSVAIPRWCGGFRSPHSPGARTFAGSEPSRKIGVVVFTNSGGADDIGYHLLDPDLPLAATPAPPT
jgi:hypothetical protein